MSSAQFEKALGCLLVFCLSSQWLYMNGIAPLMLASAVLVITLGLALVVGKIQRISLNTLSLSVAFLYLSILFLGILSLAINGGEPELKRIFGVVLLILFGLTVRQIFRQDTLITSIKFVLALHIILLLVQQIFYFGFNFLIDYQALMGFPKSGMRSNTFLFGREILRFGGLYDEPGSFAVHIGPLLLFLIAKNMRSRSDQILITIGLLTLSLTFSTYAALVVLGALLLEISNKRRLKNGVSNGAMINIVIISMGLFTSFAIVMNKRFFLRQALNEESGISYRLNTINYFIQSYFDDPWIGIIGAGVFDKSSIFFDNDAADIILNDTGLIFFMAISAGVPLCLIFITNLYSKFYYNWSYGVIAGVVFFSKLSLFSVYTVFLLIGCLTLAERKNK